MILVTGATGRTGSLIVKALNQRNIQPRVFVRDLQKANKVLSGASYEAVTGDFSMSAMVGQALEGISSVYLVTNEDEEFPSQLDHFICAAESAGIRRLVVLSALADSSSDIDFVRWHGEYEDRIKASTLNYTIIYPEWFMQNYLGHAEAGEFRFPGGKAKVSFIDAMDVAEFAVFLLLLKSGHERKTYSITGPEAFTFEELVGLINKMLASEIRHKLRFVYVDPEKFYMEMLHNHMPKRYADMYIGMTKALQEGVDSLPNTTFENIMGRPPGTFNQFIQTHKDFLVDCLN